MQDRIAEIESLGKRIEGQQGQTDHVIAELHIEMDELRETEEQYVSYFKEMNIKVKDLFDKLAAEKPKTVEGEADPEVIRMREELQVIDTQDETILNQITATMRILEHVEKLSEGFIKENKRIRAICHKTLESINMMDDAEVVADGSTWKRILFSKGEAMKIAADLALAGYPRCTEPTLHVPETFLDDKGKPDDGKMASDHNDLMRKLFNNPPST